MSWMDRQTTNSTAEALRRVNANTRDTQHGKSSEGRNLIRASIAEPGSLLIFDSKIGFREGVV